MTVCCTRRDAVVDGVDADAALTDCRAPAGRLKCSEYLLVCGSRNVQARWQLGEVGEKAVCFRCRSSPEGMNKNVFQGVLRLMIRLESLYRNGNGRPYVENCHGPRSPAISHQCQPADMVIKPRAASLPAEFHCSAHDWEPFPLGDSMRSGHIDLS